MGRVLMGSWLTSFRDAGPLSHISKRTESFKGHGSVPSNLTPCSRFERWRTPRTHSWKRRNPSRGMLVFYHFIFPCFFVKSQQLQRAQCNWLNTQPNLRSNVLACCRACYPLHLTVQRTEHVWQEPQKGMLHLFQWWHCEDRDGSMQLWASHPETKVAGSFLVWRGIHQNVGKFSAYTIQESENHL